MSGLDSPFDRYGPAQPQSPVVLSVPHAGRFYPPEMRDAVRLPLEALQSLEDRYVDAVALAAHGAAGGGETLFVQRVARAWIDLNRDERERDPRLDDGADTRRMASESHRVRSGLGLVPRRAASGADIWRRRLAATEVDARIAAHHRPYHAALAESLAAARARFGIAVLIDIHSMPPLGTRGTAPLLVLGDRFGWSAAARIVSVMEAVAESAGIAHALNTPYSGGHVLERHARTAANVHAVQVELCRSLYLDAQLAEPGPGMEGTVAMLRRMIDAVTDEALRGGPAAPSAIAAE